MKKCKGFSLIECIVALAILGIASLTMAEIYGRISMVNRNNHLVNTSLSYQMQVVEEKTNTEAIKISSGESATPPTDPPHRRSNINYLRIERADTGDVYSYPVDCYVLLSRDTDNNAYAAADDKETNLRYKYLVGSN